MDLAIEIREGRQLLRRHPIGPPLALVSFVISGVNGAGEHVGLPALGWLALGEAAVVLSLVRELRSQRAMDPEHAAALKRIATSLHDSIMTNGEAIYRDGDRMDDIIRTRFLDHHRELVPELKEWESFKGREIAARATANEAIYHDGVARWLSTDGWSFGTIISYAQSYVERSVDQEYATEQPKFSVVGETVVQGQNSGSVVRWLSNADADKGDEYVAQLQAWVLDMSKLDTVGKWRQIQNCRREVRASLLQELQEVMHAPKLKQSRCGNGCRAY